MVPTHGVDCDRQHTLEGALYVTAVTLFLLNLDHFAAFILSAVRASAVRKLLLMTVGALGKPGVLEFIVTAPVAAAGGRMSSFGIGHFSLSLKS
jgi:hypothetical protein